MTDFKEQRDKAADEYYHKATVYFTDMNPEALSGTHYFKKGADWARYQQASVVADMFNQNLELRKQLNTAIETLKEASDFFGDGYLYPSQRSQALDARLLEVIELLEEKP